MAAYAQPQEGSILFVGYNADGNDGVAFVTLIDIPADSTVYFTDNEWQGNTFNTGEGLISWSHNAMVPAGTVIDIDGTGGTPTASLGTAVSISGSMNLGASNEVCYAFTIFQGDTVFLSAISSDGFGSSGDIVNTGLIVGTSAIEITGDEDVMAYVGTRSGEVNFEDYAALICNTANWITQDASGDQHNDGIAPDVPFNTTPFTTLQPPAEGDVIFTAFNADGDDGFAIVTLIDLPANTEIWFTDNEWNGFSIQSGMGHFIDSAEGSFMWTDTVMHPAGTVITFEEYSVNGIETVSSGTVTGGIIPNEGFSGGSEVVYMYLGAELAPTVFLSAITNDNFPGEGTIDSTGLVDGVTAFTIGGGTDIAEYVGPRLGESLFSDYRPLVYDLNNWLTQNDGGDQSNDGIAPDMPFNVTAFDTGSNDNVPPVAQSASPINGTMTFVQFTEMLDSATVVDTNNFLFSPALAIDSVQISASGDTAFIFHAAFTNGLPYDLEVREITDTAGNIMDTTTFQMVWNESTPALVITEVIHSPNTVEMIEVYNNSGAPVQLGGLRWTDGTTGDFPVMTLPADTVVLFSTDPASASSLMGGTYYLLNNGLGGSGDDLVIRNSAGVIIDSIDYSTSSPWPAEPSGPYANSIELIDANLDNNVGSNWMVPVQVISSTNGDIYATPGVYPPPPLTGPAVISLVEARASIMEDAGTVDIIVSILNSGDSATSVDLELISFGTAMEGSDFDYPMTQSFSFAPNSMVMFDTITIAITDDGSEENSEYFAFKLGNPVNAEVGANADFFTVMINDNDMMAPAPTKELKLNYVTSYEHAPGTGSTAEIVAHDPLSQRLYITNFEFNRLDMVDFSDPMNPDSLGAIDLSSYGDLTSVAVMNGIVAVSAANPVATDSGKVIFLDTNGALLSQVSVGILPDMVTFNHAGDKVLTANEGQPNDAYTNDPEGSISIIDISGGAANVTQANVSNARFAHFNGQEVALRAAGVRITGPSGTSTAQDMEPEYITISDDDAFAYVTCQENNVLAVVDIANDSIIEILPLGSKDHMLEMNSLDANNDLDNIEIASWPLKGVYMPDAIGHFSVGGMNYLVTANEGDAREYGNYEDVNRLEDNEIELDSTAFPYGNLLKSNIGRINVLNTEGDIDNDGDFDELYVMGARSFSIWDASNGNLVYDSGNDFELITAQHPEFSAIFNASNSNNTFKNRSDDKGPEPEGILIQEINGSIYAFTALERIGGLMVYNVTDPSNPVFVDYVNNRDVNSFAGDHGPEGILYISAEDSPNGREYVILANEVSGTLSIFETIKVNVAEYTLGSSPLIGTYDGIDMYEGGFSGMSKVPGEENLFYVVGDRGPNAIGDANVNNTNGDAIKVFPVPTYAPKIWGIAINGDSISIIGGETIKRPDGTNASGLPNPVGLGGTGEVAWSDTVGTVIPADLWGIDSEGIIEGLNEDLWIADEYGASVWHLDNTGKVINRYWPFDAQPNNLPIDTIFKYRKANRGFEGVTMTPNGKVYACIQSGMNNPNSTAGNNTRLLRILEIDPSTGNTQMFAYELEPGIGGSSGIRVRDWKLGDLAAINNHEFLILEHAERGGYNSKKVYKFDISNATLITSENFGGLTFEELIDANGAAGQGIQAVEKEMYLDLLQNGWDLTLDKPEGLAIMNDSTIAVVNDNDFGIDSPAEDGTIVATGKQTKLYVYTTPSMLKSPLNFCEPIRVNVEGDVNFCDGDSVQFNVRSGENYTWYNGNTNLNISDSVFTAKANGEYYAKSMAPQCEAESRKIMVEVNDLPQVVLANDTTVCDGESVSVSAMGPNMAAFDTYLWSNGQTTQMVTLNSTGDFTVTVTDTNGCVNEMLDTFNLTIQQLPDVNLGNDTSICIGENITFSAPAGLTTYAWSNSAMTSSINVNAAGTYSVTATDAIGCTGSDDIVLTIDALPVVNLGNDTAFCDGNSLALTAPAGMTVYDWSNSSATQSINVSTSGGYSVTITDANGCQNNDFIVITVDTLPVFSIENDTICANESASLSGPSGLYSFSWSNSSNSQVINTNVAGTYTLTVTNANGCESSASAELTVNALPTVAISGNHTICASDTAMLDAGAFDSYMWSNGASTQMVNVTGAGVYGVTVTDANDCQNADTITVTVNALPFVFAGVDAEVCDGESATLNAQGAVTYTWSNGVANGTSFVPTATETYTVIGEDANGCENEDSLTITVNPLPTVNAGDDVEVCDGESVTWNASGASTYVWSNGIGNGTSFIPSQTGAFTVTGTDANGCSDDDEIVVTVNDLPMVDLGPNQTICNKQIITIDAGAGFSSYLWSTGATTQTIDVDTTMAGTISVVVTDGNDCEGYDEVVVQAYVCLGVGESSLNNEVSIYPNPANDVLNISLGDQHEVESIQLIDFTGRVVESKGVNSDNEQLTVSGLAAGVYTLKLIGNNGAQLGAHRVVISR